MGLGRASAAALRDGCVAGSRAARTKTLGTGGATIYSGMRRFVWEARNPVLRCTRSPVERGKRDRTLTSWEACFGRGGDGGFGDRGGVAEGVQAVPPAAPAKTIFFFLEMLRGHKEDLDKAAHLSFTFFNLFVLKESFFLEKY